MKKIPKRAVRRHHYNRLKKKRGNYWSGDLSEREQGMVVATPRLCSCVMCGNPRRHLGEKTIQERRCESL
jgi:hypothetical protein